MANPSFSISIGVDGSQVNQGLASVRSQFQQASVGIDVALRNISGFADLRRGLTETESALNQTRQRVADLARSVREQGNIGETLQRGLDTARASVEQLRGTITQQQTALTQARQRVNELTREWRQAGQEQQRLTNAREIDVRALGQAQARYSQLTAELQRARAAQDHAAQGVQNARTAYTAARQSVADYQRRIRENASALAENQRAFEQARNEARNLSQVYAVQRQELQGMRQALSQAGISTTSLASSQRELRAALGVIRTEFEAVQRVANARDALGVQAHAQIQAEINRTRQALTEMRRAYQEGRITAQEWAQAQAAAGQRIGELRNQVGGASRQLQDLRMAYVGVTAAVAGLAASLKSGIDKFVEFDDAMRRTGALVKSSLERAGNSSEQIAAKMSALRKQAQELGATTRFTAVDAGRAFQQLAAGGQKLDDMTKSIKHVMDMAAAGGLDVAEAADQMTNIMGAFQIKAARSREVADALTAGFTGAATTLDQLANAMVYCGPVANTLGYTMQDTTGILMALADAGIKGEQAGTVLRGAMARLIRPARMGQEVLDKYKIQLRDSNGAMRDFVDILHDVGAAGLSEGEKIKLFGVEAGPGMMSLLDKGAAAIKEYQRQVNESGGRAAQVAQDMEEGLGGAMRRLDAATSAIVTNFGDVFAPAISKAADAAAGLATVVADLPGPIKLTVGALTAGGAAFMVWKAGLASLRALPNALQALTSAEAIAERQTERLRAEMARIGPTAVANFDQAAAAAGRLNARMGATAAGATAASGAVSKLAKATQGLAAAGAALSAGWAFGEFLNNFQIVRKSGASLIYSLDRVRLAAVKMWRSLTGGDVGSVDREIEAAKRAYDGLIQDIEKNRDEWKLKKDGKDKAEPDESDDETDKTDKPARSPNDDAKQEREQDEAEAQERAEKRREREQAIDEELAEKRRAREEQAFEEALKRKEELENYNRGDRSEKDEWAERLEREKELPEDREEAAARKKAHEEEMARLEEERKKAEQAQDEAAAEDAEKRRRQAEAEYAEEVAQREHEQRLRLIDLEEQAANAAHEDAMARIEREAEARRAEYERRKADIEAERADIRAAHEEKMALLDEEIAAAREAGDEKAVAAAEKKKERAEKAYEKDLERLDKEATKADRAEEQARQDDDRKRSDQQASHAREQDKQRLKRDKENESEQARREQAEKERKEAEARAREEAEVKRREREEQARQERERRQQEREAERRRRDEERRNKKGSRSSAGTGGGSADADAWAEQEREEQERLERERQEQERLERERLRREQEEQARQERGRQQREQEEQARLEQERLQREQEEQARLERERQQREQEERERQERERLEREREAREQAERERQEREREEQERQQREREEQARLEQERLQREQEEQERQERERLEREREAREQAEREREEREREEREGLERERQEREREEQERRQREQEERERQREKQRQAADEAASAARGDADQWSDSQKRAAEEATRAVEDYYAKLKSASEDVANRQKSLSEELLDLDTTKTEKQKWQILAKQAREYEKQAKAAMEAGDLEKAKELADQAKSAYGRLKGGAEGVDAKQAQRQTYAGVKSAGELGVAIAKMQEVQAAAEAKKQERLALKQNQGVNDLAARVKELKEDYVRNQGVATVGQAGAEYARAVKQRDARDATGGERRPDKTVELKLGRARLQGSAADADEFLRQLEQAGMTA